MRQIVAEIARQQDVGLVDYVDLLEKKMQETKGYPIPGKEFFLDHVHPTIEGHKILAVALVQKMIDQGLLQPGASLDEQKVSKIAAKIEGRINREAHGQALANLARVLLWAGKQDDAARLALQAQETAGDTRQVAVDSASILASVYFRQDRPEEAMLLLYKTLEFAPGAMEIRLKLGENLIETQFLNLEEAAANFLLISQQMPSYDRAHELYGFAMSKRGRLGVAYASLMEALRLNPNNSHAKLTLARIRQIMGSYTPNPQPAELILTLYPSEAPHTLTQVRRDVNGQAVIDGVKVEFYENGRLKYFADIDQGQLNGLEMNWDSEGQLLSRKAYQNGVPLNERPGS
jgi:tetratricopeptide (TPR) repeat protein